MGKTQPNGAVHEIGELDPRQLPERRTAMASRLGLAQTLVLGLAALMVFCPGIASARAYTKPKVANLILKVEDGVDQFRDYLERNGDDAKERADSAKNNRTPNQSSRRKPQNTEARKQQAGDTKDELDDALGDLNRSTNRLRRKFDMTDTWMETKVQVEKVVDDGRRVNQVMTRGRYGTQAERYWGVLRTAINDLARAYGVPPLGL
jgi:hypothetical protein